MTLAQLLALANQKATEAQAILEGESPTAEDVERANGLISESEGYQSRAETMRKAQTLAKATAPEPTPDPKPAKSGIVVVADEADKLLEAKPFKTAGEFFMAVVHGNDSRLPPLRSDDPLDERGYNLGKALGKDKVGSLYGARLSHQKAIGGMSELVPADGGLLVQTDTQMSIMERVYSTGSLLQRVAMIPISANSNSLTLYGVDETSRATGSRQGGIQFYWASEGEEKTGSKPKFREINFKLNKAIGLVKATDELLADASALEGWIMQRLPQELRFGVEDSIIRGTGAGQPLGVLNAGCTVSVAKEDAQDAATVVSQNIIKMWARRWAASNDYVWLINQDVTPQLHQLNLPVGTGGALVYMPPGGLSQSPYGSLYGRPVIEIEYCSTVGTVGDVILFSPSAYQMIDKGGVQSAVSIHVLFTTDQSVFRFVLRVDGKPLWHQPLTPYQGTKTQSPFITLATRE